jgi:hypothetical protein
MGEILNRREQIKAAAIPPEIADASTLVTKTDYATASKAGVVKVGANISVASGKISVADASDEVAGVVKVGSGLEVDESGFLNATAAGAICDKLFDGNVVQGGSTPRELSAAYTGYKFLVFVKTAGVNVEYGYPMITDAIATGTNNMNASGIGNIRFDAEDATKFLMPQGTGSVSIKVYGIK